MTGERATHDGWVPARAQWRGDALSVHWCHLGGRRFSEPFFEDTIGCAMRAPFNLLFGYETPIEDLREWHAACPGLAPTGFVFHMSRCGSTLVAQMLATLAESVVLSEASPIDTVLRGGGASAVDETTRIAWLRWMISALGQRRSGAERHLFIKFDSWHALDLAVVRKAYPSVPWVFLFRDPVEVLVSQLRQRGAQMVPGMLGPIPAGVDAPDAARLAPEEYAARVLADVCTSALQHVADPKGMFVNYRGLPDAVWKTIAPHFGLVPRDDAQNAIAAKAKYDAKNPAFEFARDIESKQAAASDRIRAAAARWLMPLYERLESAATGGTPAAARLARETGSTSCAPARL